MFFTEATVYIQLLFTDVNKGEKKMDILKLPSSNENNKTVPSIIIFSLFVVTESVPFIYK